MRKCAGNSHPLHLGVSVKGEHLTLLLLTLSISRMLAGHSLQTGTAVYGGGINTHFSCHSIWVCNPEKLLENPYSRINRTLGRLNSIAISFRLYLLFPLLWQFAYSLVVSSGPFSLSGPYGLPLSPKNSASRGSRLAQTPNSGRRAVCPFYLDFSLPGLCPAW